MGRALCAVGALLLVGCAETQPPIEMPVNQPPTVAITSPADGSTFAGGDELTIAVSGDDAEDGTLGTGALTWWGVLHHGDHTHPFVVPTAGTGGPVQVPSSGHVETNIFYRFYAVAVDSEGLADTAFVDVQPRLIDLTFETVPAGLEIVFDGQPRQTPLVIESVVGIDHLLDAPTQDDGGTSWIFSSWSQGGSGTQTYTAPDTDQTLVATFADNGAANVPPTVSVSAPTSGATLTTGVPVALSADAADSDGTVERVSFFAGGGLVAVDSAAPFSTSWTPTAAGADSVWATAVDDDAALTVSAVVPVTVQSGGGDLTPPVATLTAPSQGSLNLSGSINLSATASDDVGVVEVEFQVDGSTIEVDNLPPYDAVLPATSDYASGAHTFRARARDAAGNLSDWSAATVTFGGGVSLPAGFSQSTYVSGFNATEFFPLTAAAFAPDGRLFVTEMLGSVRVVSAAGNLLSTPFATFQVDDAGERGLIGIALDPDFASNGYVYVHYTARTPSRNRISRLTASGNVAAPGSEVVLVEFETLGGAPFHNGGGLAFGTDGTLFVGVGDATEPAAAQSLTSRFGKILRYNADGTIPTDNPYFGTATGEFRAIWARGLRNPFTIAVQPSTGRLHINDVGQDDWEEINLGRAGANYGWPTSEGPTTNPSFDAPILTYSHFNSPTLFEGFSIVGAAFYEPPVNTFGADYQGDFFFGDFVNGWVYRLDSDEWTTAYAFARPTTGTDLVNLLVGPDGALYVLIGNRIDRIQR